MHKGTLKMAGKTDCMPVIFRMCIVFGAGRKISRKKNENYRTMCSGHLRGERKSVARQIDPRAVSPGGGRAPAGKNGDTWLQSGAVEQRSVDCRSIRYAEVKVFRRC